jgi:hypothetical protein
MSKNILGYDIAVSQDMFDMKLDCVEVSCRFYFEQHNLTQREVTDLKMKLFHSFNKVINKMGYKEITPHRVSELTHKEV